MLIKLVSPQITQIKWMEEARLETVDCTTLKTILIEGRRGQIKLENYSPIWFQINQRSSDIQFQLINVENDIPFESDDIGVNIVLHIKQTNG